MVLLIGVAAGLPVAVAMGLVTGRFSSRRRQAVLTPDPPAGGQASQLPKAAATSQVVFRILQASQRGRPARPAGPGHPPGCDPGCRSRAGLRSLGGPRPGRAAGAADVPAPAARRGGTGHDARMTGITGPSLLPPPCAWAPSTIPMTVLPVYGGGVPLVPGSGNLGKYRGSSNERLRLADRIPADLRPVSGQPQVQQDAWQLCQEQTERRRS